MELKDINLCIEKVRRYLSKADITSYPYFINVENKEYYIAIKDALEPLLNVISVSNYCRSDDALPDIDNLMSDLRNTTKNSLLIGFSQYLKLRGESLLNQNINKIKCLSTKNAKIVILCYQIERELQQELKNDLRLNNRIIFLKGDASPKPHFIFAKAMLSNKNINNLNIGFKCFLRTQESICTDTATISTIIDIDVFKDSICNVKLINNIFETIYLIDTNIYSQLSAVDGTNDKWEYLVNKIQLNGSFLKALAEEIGETEKFDRVFHKWSSFSDNQKWLYWLALKSFSRNNSYLSMAANSSRDIIDFIKNIYNNILEYEYSDYNFKQVYIERKILLNYVKSIRDITSFCALAESKKKNKIYYLTDITDIEKKEIVKCLCDNIFTRKQINDILEFIYPELWTYLLPFNFNKPLFDNYFQDYKYQKLTNRIYPEFLELVNRNAASREFNYELPSRIEKFEKINRDNSLIYFFDALGVEFMGYITHKCNELGIEMKSSICRANLPSITLCNKDFLEYIDEPINIKKLDEVKHSGEGDFDFKKTHYPIHIPKELEIIDEVLKNVLTKLLLYSKVIIVSDHGASRLVVINKQQYNFDVNSKGTHGGRCCEYNKEIRQVKYATEESGYYVLASYDRFKGGRAASVETHGGATLEEVVIPIIELTMKSSQIYIKLIETEVVTSYKKKAELVFISSCVLKNVSVKIDEYFYTCAKNEGLKYYVPIANIKKSGRYVAEIYESNNFIAKLDFRVRKESSAEKELF